jgi:Na+/proline symporter
LSDQPAPVIPIILGIRLDLRLAPRRFLCRIFTKRRGNNRGYIIAMIIGFIVVAILGGLPNNVAGIFGRQFYTQPIWLPAMACQWWICFGTIVTFSVAILFRTGREHRPPA